MLTKVLNFHDIVSSPLQLGERFPSPFQLLFGRVDVVVIHMCIAKLDNQLMRIRASNMGNQKGAMLNGIPRPSSVERWYIKDDSLAFWDGLEAEGSRT